MPKQFFTCEICGTHYDTCEQAIACEAQPIINPYGIKRGDEIIITRKGIPAVGHRGIVDTVYMQRNHNPEFSVYFKNTNMAITVNTDGCIPFIDAMLPEIAEKLGEAVHNMWMAKRKAEKRWHSPEECPDKKKGCSNCDHWNDVDLCGKGHNIKKPSNHDCSDFFPRNLILCSQCHTCMRPYKDLPDSEKELDRAYPAEFIKILDSLGYMLTRKPEKL